MCKKMIENDGTKWRISKERREEEKAREDERQERLSSRLVMTQKNYHLFGELIILNLDQPQL